MFPLAIPGGPEIAIILLLFLLPVLIIVFIALLIRDLFGGDSVAESRIDELEAEVRNLKEELKMADGDGEQE